MENKMGSIAFKKLTQDGLVLKPKAVYRDLDYKFSYNQVKNFCEDLRNKVSGRDTISHNSSIINNIIAWEVVVEKYVSLFKETEIFDIGFINDDFNASNPIFGSKREAENFLRHLLYDVVGRFFLRK